MKDNKALITIFILLLIICSLIFVNINLRNKDNAKTKLNLNNIKYVNVGNNIFKGFSYSEAIDMISQCIGFTVSEITDTTEDEIALIHLKIQYKGEINCLYKNMYILKSIKEYAYVNNMKLFIENNQNIVSTFDVYFRKRNN